MVWKIIDEWQEKQRSQNGTLQDTRCYSDWCRAGFPFFSFSYFLQVACCVGLQISGLGWATWPSLSFEQELESDWFLAHHHYFSLVYKQGDLWLGPLPSSFQSIALFLQCISVLCRAWHRLCLAPVSVSSKEIHANCTVKCVYCMGSKARMLQLNMWHCLRVWYMYTWCRPWPHSDIVSTPCSIAQFMTCLFFTLHRAFPCFVCGTLVLAHLIFVHWGPLL